LLIIIIIIFETLLQTLEVLGLKHSPEHPKEVGLVPCTEQPKGLGLKTLLWLLSITAKKS
jgi:hypothetical protein